MKLKENTLPSDIGISTYDTYKQGCSAKALK